MRDFAIVASNKFKVSSTKANGIKINNYYYAGKSAKIYNQLAKQTAVDSIKLFTKKYGPYPYSELDLTESPFGSDTGGMEYSGLVMIAQDTFARKKSASKEDYDSVIENVSHEVAHQWFFNTVGNDEYTEPWLDEGWQNSRKILSLIYLQLTRFLRNMMKLILPIMVEKVFILCCVI